MQLITHLGERNMEALLQTFIYASAAIILSLGFATIV